MKNKPLSGIKVLDFTRMLAGPYCTMLLGDLGAEVIKIEGPNEGDPIRTQGPPFFHDSGVTFYATNRNKYSCAINMRTPEGKLLAQKLASKADIIVEGDAGKMIVKNPEGGMGFAKGVAVTGKENPESMVVQTYVFVSECNEMVAEAHQTAVANIGKEEPLIQTPPEKKIIT